MRKVCVVITARASYCRIKTALTAINQHPELTLQLVVAASALVRAYGSAAHCMEMDGFEIQAKIYNAFMGDEVTAAAKTTGLGILELSSAFEWLKPDIVITIADRYETLATAVSASFMNIPLAHIQGGEVSGNIDEKVRHAITKLADSHFVASEEARERVIKMGENPEHVFNTGCPAIDIAVKMLAKDRVPAADVWRKYAMVELESPATEYITVLQHSVTTELQSACQQIKDTIEAIKEARLPTFWFLPNSDPGSGEITSMIEDFLTIEKKFPLHVLTNLTPEDFLELVRNTACLVGNSSTGIRECAVLGVPVVNIGTRQKGRMRGKNVIDTTYSGPAILKAINRQRTHGPYESEHLLGDGTAGKQIASLLARIPLTFNKKITY